MKKLFLSFGLAAVGLLSSITASAQINVLVLHNCPSKEADTVDVWVDGPGVPSAPIKLVDNLAFRSAKFLKIGYPALPLGTNLVITDKNSTGVGTPIFTKSVAGLAAGNYTLIATGLIDSSIKVNPNGINKAFDLDLSTGSVFASGDPTKFSVAIKHGVVDAPKVTAKAFITTIQSTLPDVLADTVAFREITSYGNYPAASRRIHVFPGTSSTPLVKYNGDALKTLGGKGALVFASGFLDTTGTGTKNTFGLYAVVIDTNAVLPAGSPLKSLDQVVVALPTEKVAGLVQVYHNAADTLLKSVDLYVGGIKQIIGLDFRKGFQSAGFIQDFDYNLGIAKKGSSTIELTSTLRLNSDSIVAVLSGVLDTTKFKVNPDGGNRKLAMFINKPVRVTQPVGSTQITIFHGATDAPTVGVSINANVPTFGGTPLITGLKYGQFQTASVPGVGTSLPTGLGNLVVDLKVPGGGIYKSYIVPLAALDGKAVTVCASGFLDTTAANSGGPSFKLFAGISAPPTPQIVFLKDTVVFTSINDPSKADMQFRMFPNPATSELVMAFDVKESSNVTIDILDLTGRVVSNVVNSVFDNGTVALTQDIRGLQSGLYIARVMSDNKVSSYKFNVVR
jgi:hypothetical protein